MPTLLSTVLHRLRRRRPFGDLFALDDKLLADLGVTRGELGAVRRTHPRHDHE